MKFKDIINEENGVNESENEWKQILTKLKADLKKAKFTSWEYEGDYEVIVVTFKDNATALKAFRKQKEPLNFLGNAEVEGGVIRLELDSESLENLNEGKETNLIIHKDDIDKAVDLLAKAGIRFGRKVL
jgi:hypothetical protein